MTAAKFVTARRSPTRRRVLQALAAAPVLAAARARAAGEPTEGAPPLRIAVVGDSQAQGLAAGLQRLYRQEFGRLLNFARFTVDDSYGREVLQEALRANNQELAAMARFFIDEKGRPRQHRRASPAQAQAL